MRGDMGNTMQLPIYMEAVIYALIFFLGTAIFSFLNVVIYRLPRHEDFVTGRSKCPDCGHMLSFLDMVPILSWFLLGRKCRYCKAKISARYPIVEALGGIAALLSVYIYGLSIYAILVFALCSLLTCVGFIDHDEMIIPDGLNIAIATIGVAAVFLTEDTVWYEHIIGLFIISVFMLILAIIIPQAFGGGDIKLMAGCGLFLGWKNTVFAFFAAVVIGGIFAAFKMIKKEKGKKDLIPFGPFICVGVVLAVFVGDMVMDIYLGTLLGL